MEAGLEFRQVRYFLAACDHMSFTRAAEACAVSQPALTVAIRKLEEELGGPLFLREGRGLRLTELGRAMRTHLARVEETREAARLTAQRIVDQDMEMIDVGVMCTVGPNAIGPALSDWSALNDRAELVLHDVWSARAQELLLSGALDCAIIGRRAPSPPRFDAQPLFEEPFVLAAAADHPLAAEPRLPLEAVSGQRYVDRLRCEFREDFFDILADRKLDVDLVLRSEREDWIQTAVSAGLGVSIVPRDMLMRTGIVTRAFEDLSVTRDVEILTVRGRQRSTALERFLAFMAERDWTTGAGSPTA